MKPRRRFSGCPQRCRGRDTHAAINVVDRLDVGLVVDGLHGKRLAAAMLPARCKLRAVHAAAGNRRMVELVCRRSALAFALRNAWNAGFRRSRSWRDLDELKLMLRSLATLHVQPKFPSASGRSVSYFGASSSCYTCASTMFDVPDPLPQQRGEPFVVLAVAPLHLHINLRGHPKFSTCATRSAGWQ